MSNPGQAAVGIVGGIIGFALGGPTGAAYGLQIGLAVGSVVSPTQLPGTFGPRLTDNRTTSAQLGGPIVELWGTDAVAGTVIWLGELEEHSSTEEVGGKGGPEGEQTTFTYTQSIAIGLCRGPQAGVARIWENGKLVYDTRPPQLGESVADYGARIDAAAAYAQGFTLYLGSESQLPDPTIEMKEGAGNVPAYRGLMYIVYHDRLLQDDQAQRHPSFKFEVIGANTPINTLLAMFSAAPEFGAEEPTLLPDSYALVALPTALDAPAVSRFPDTYDSARVHATDICGNGIKLFAVGKLSESQYWARFSSDAGASWDPVLITASVETLFAAQFCTVGPTGRLVVTGTIQPSGNDGMLYSDNDGGLWLPCATAIGVVPDFRFGVVRYLPDLNIWLVGGFRGIAKSLDGFQWDSKLVAVVGSVLAFAFGDGRVAALYAGAIRESLDAGETWAEVYESAEPQRAIAYGNGLWLRVCEEGFSRATTLDGPWSALAAPPGWNMFDVLFDGGQFIAVGQNFDGESLIGSSADGLTWIELSSGHVDAALLRIQQLLP